MKKFCFMPLGIVFFASNMAFAADEIHYTITGNNSVTFDWRGSALENSIDFGLSPGAYTKVKAQSPSRVPTSSQGPFWEVKLTGLKENTLYYYSIGNGPERTFRTAPAPGSSDFTVFAQGDIGNTSAFFNMGVVQDLIANGRPAFVIGLGNLSLGSTNGKAAVDQHFNDVMLWSKEAAYMPVWGDQEWLRTRSDNINNYKGRFDLPNPQASAGASNASGEDWYWFDYGNARFIALPKSLPGAWMDWNNKADALMTEAQVDPNIKFIVTMAHESAYSSGHYPGSNQLKGIMDALGDRHSKYVLNINSQSRNYERSHPQHGVVHVTAGIGGANFQQDGDCLWLTCSQPSWSAFRAMHHGALKLHFSASGIEGSLICGPAGGGLNDLNCTKGAAVDNFTIASSASADALTADKVAVNAGTGLSLQLAAASSGACTQTALNVSGATSDGGYSYRVSKAFGTPADNSGSYTRSTLRFFENGVEMGPAHSIHADISNLGAGRFSHWSATNGTGEALRFSASNNTNPKTNGKAYSYCLSTTTTTTTSTPSAVDSQAPSIPANVKATASSSTQISLSWSASTDNKGVSGYKVYRNGTQIASIASTAYSDSGLSAGASYNYAVAAFDAAGNNSGNSATSTATTTNSAVLAASNCATAPTSSLVVNVKDKGATGNGSTNDTAAIQAAITQVGGSGGTVLVPDGTYMIDAITHLRLKSNMTLRMTNGAVLKAIPNNQNNSGVVRVENASNVNVIGGTVQGERTLHQGTSGQWGHGVEIYASNTVAIDGVTSKDNWGDGFYIGEASKAITVCSVTADNNRRQGLSITSVDGAVIKDSVFKKSNGFYPNAGLDIEPDPGYTVNNVKILNSQFMNNRGTGILLSFPSVAARTSSTISNVTIDGNTVSNNGVVGTYSAGIYLSSQKTVKVTNNIVSNNVQDGLILVENSSNNTVTGNTITGSGYGNNVDSYIGYGILIYEAGGNNTVTNNKITGNKAAIYDSDGNNTISPNTLN